MRRESLSNIENKINNTLELSSICRGEWCRLIEPEVDRLDTDLHEKELHAASLDKGQVRSISSKIRKAYKNVGPGPDDLKWHNF